MKGVTRGLYSAPPGIFKPRFLHAHTWMSFDMHMYHDQTCRKQHGATLSLQQEVSYFNSKFAFHPHFDTFPCLLLFFFSFTNSVSMILRPWRWKVIKSIRLLQTWWVSLSDPFSCFVHKAWSPNSFNIQFPMNNKFITHVYDVALNTSMHQYCVILIAPPTGHRNSDKHHPIYMTFMGFLSIPYTTTWYATRRSAHPPTAPLPDACGLQINQNITDHKFVWGIFHL